MHFEEQPVIAAVRDKEGIVRACESACEVLFLLSANVIELPALISLVHQKGKKLFLHIDLCEGVGKDAYGVRYLSSLGVDGIISTRTGLIKAAKECGVRCVQRFFMVDSRSVDTALEAIRTAHPDMIEIMPAIATKTITRLARTVSVPIIAGGLLEEKKEIFAALSAGAAAISTGSSALWNLE